MVHNNFCRELYYGQCVCLCACVMTCSAECTDLASCYVQHCDSAAEHDMDFHSENESIVTLLLFLFRCFSCLSHVDLGWALLS